MAVAGTSAGFKKIRAVKKKSTRDNDGDGSLSLLNK